MPNNLILNIHQLARVRQELDQARLAYATQLYAFEATPEMSNLSGKIEALKSELEVLDSSIRHTAAQELNLTGQTGHPAIKIRTVTDIVIDEVQALAWANINMPIAVIQTIDKKLLTDYAKKHGPGWAIVGQYQQITIAKDLAPFLDFADPEPIGFPPE